MESQAATVELGDREAIRERERLDLAAMRADDEPVVDEVERRVEGDALVAHRLRAEPAGIDAEGDVPPVVARRRRRELHLADDLRPEVERVPWSAARPRTEAQVGQPSSSTNITSST